MLTLPSVWNLVISTLVFFIAARYFHRYLDVLGIPKGMTRGILVFSLASVVSWGSGEMVDWTQEKIEGPRPQVAQSSDDLSQLLTVLGQGRPLAGLKGAGAN